MAVNLFQNGGTDNNWGTISNWSLGVVPTGADGNIATFDATSPNCTVNTSTRAANMIDFTGYTNTITMTFGINVSGNTTLGSGMGVAGTGTLAVIAAATLTSNGKVFPNTLSLAVAGILTFADAWTVSGLISLSGAVVLNGFTLTATGGLTQVTTATPGGTTVIIFGGTSQTFNLGTGAWKISTIFNLSGTLTISGSTWNTGGAGAAWTFTYTAGTIVSTGVTLSIGQTSGTTPTFAWQGMIWNGPITFAGITNNNVVTLSNDLITTGLVTFGASWTVPTFNGPGTLYPRGGMTALSSSGVLTGTMPVIFDETCTITASVPTGVWLRLLTTINGPGKTITTVGTICGIDFSRFRYVAGTVAPANAASWSASASSGTPSWAA